MTSGTRTLIRAVIRPEREAQVLERLEAEGFYAMTKVPVMGRGRQRGIQVGEVAYDELAKVMLCIVVDGADLSRVVQAIEEGGRTGHHGDGKVFIQRVRESYTIRSGARE